MKKLEYEITIKPKRRGHCVTIGCQEFSFGESDVEMNLMAEFITDYMDNPEIIRGKYPDKSKPSIYVGADNANVYYPGGFTYTEHKEE